MTRPVVLVIEDEPLIAMDLQESLQERGFVVVGPCRTEAEALVALATLRPHVAILDVLLTGARTDRIAAALLASGVPFATFTGEARSSLPDALRAAPYVAKPADMEALAMLLRGLVGEA